MRKRTEAFRQTFYDSTLPYWLLDCVTANAAITRHIGVVFRIANGDMLWLGRLERLLPADLHACLGL